MPEIKKKCAKYGADVFPESKQNRQVQNMLEGE
jgi:hypothetical protein